MTRILLATAAVLWSVGVASAQTGTTITPAPTTKGTTSDTRTIDEAQAPAAGASTASPSSPGTTTDTASPPTSGSWRTSNGLNNDPNNPSGAPK